MRIFLSILILLGMGGIVYADVPVPIAASYTAVNIAAVKANNLASKPSIRITGYYAAGDGGEGAFQSMGTTTCTDDGGSVIKDGANNCFKRANLNGSVQQFGITSSSIYDCSPITGTPWNGTTGCIGSTVKITATQAAAVAAGLTTVSTNGLILRFGQTATIAANVTWDFGASFPKNPNSTPGTVWLDHGVSIAYGSGSTLQNFTILPTWFMVNWPTGPVTLDDNYAVISSMVSNGDTAVTCGASGVATCTLRNGTIAGFDTGYDGQRFSNTVSNVQIDANVCFYYHNSGGTSTWNNLTCNPALEKNTSAVGAWTITSVTASTANPGLCELTLVTQGTGPIGDNQIQPGLYTWTSGLDQTTGGVNANGRHKVLLVSSSPLQIDLQGTSCTGSTLAGPTVTGTWTAGVSQIAVSSLAGISPFMRFSGSPTGIGPAYYVVGLWNAKNIITLSQPPTNSCTSCSLSLYGGATGTMSASCNLANGITDDNNGPCFLMSTQERVDAGGSPGGIAAGGTTCAVGFLIGGFVNVGDGNCATGDAAAAEKVAGISVVGSFSYGHVTAYHLSNAYQCSFTNAGMDAGRNLQDQTTSFVSVDGNFKGCSFSSIIANKVGAGMLFAPTGTNRACMNIWGGNLGKYDVESGCLQINSGSSNGGQIYVANAATNVLVNGLMPNADAYYEGAAARGVTNTSGALMATGQVQPFQIKSTAPTTFASATINDSAIIWPCDATAGNVVMTVPAGSAVSAQTFDVTKIDSSSNTCTITLASGETFPNGSASVVLATRGSDLTFTNTNGLLSWTIN